MQDLSHCVSLVPAWKLYNALRSTRLAMTQGRLSGTAASGRLSIRKVRSASKYTLLWVDRPDARVLTSKGNAFKTKETQGLPASQVQHCSLCTRLNLSPHVIINVQ